MSFLKISDPVKRDLIVKEYLELKKNIRDDLLSERAGEQQLRADLSKFIKPITEMQKATTKEISEGHRPVNEGIEAITFPAYPSIQASEGEETVVAPYFIGDIAESYIGKFTTKAEADRTYGLYNRKGKFYIGNKPVVINDNNIVVDDEEYEGTPGRWELIVSKNPDETIYTLKDHENYARLMIKTSALHRANNRNINTSKGSKSDKWKKILSDIWKKKNRI